MPRQGALVKHSIALSVDIFLERVTKEERHVMAMGGTIALAE